MVDMATVTQINQLTMEHRNNVQGLAALDAGERISSMSIGGVMISTTGWDYPPPMAQSIKQQLEARQAKIESDLKELGFTGSLETEAE